MNFAFILDCSISMLQTPNNQMSLLGMAKNGIEFIIKCRTRFPESKYDHYHLITTNILNSNIISSWEHDFSHFLFQLKNITFSIRNDIVKALIDAFEIINKFRDLTGADNYLGGRDPYKTDNGIIIIFSDACDLLAIHNLETLIKESTNLCKWDQHVYIFQMAINQTNEKKSLDKINSRNFDKISQNLGGKLFLIETYEYLFQIVESFITNYKCKVCFNLEAITTSFITNAKYFVDSNIKIDNKTNFLVNMNLKLSSNYLTNKYQLENISGNLAQFPFPEEPLPLHLAYYGFPTYYIDLKKMFHYRMPNDLACERFEIDSFELGNLIKNKILEKNELKKFYFPIFVKSNYYQKEDFILFGLLKFIQNPNEDKFNMEFFCFPWNFLEFCSIWEEISKTGINSGTIQKLHLYFQKVPIYYSSYFFQLFQFKTFNDLCIKKWKFLNSQIDLTMHITNIKKNIFEKLKLKKKIDEDASISKQTHLKHEALCCSLKHFSEKIKPISNPFTDERKQKLIDELLISKSNNLNIKICEMIHDNLFINYLKKNDKKMEIENDKNNISIDVRNPYVEENEIKYVKEPVPYGNPFKLVLRSKTQKILINGEISDEAYLANIIQEKDIKKNAKSVKETPSILKKIKNNEVKPYNNNKEFSYINGVKDIGENKRSINGDIFQTLREKSHPNEYSEIFFNPKNLKTDLKKSQEFIIESSKKFIELNQIINDSEYSQEKMKRLKNFVQEWLSETGDIAVENHLRKKINEILEINSFMQEFKI